MSMKTLARATDTFREIFLLYAVILTLAALGYSYFEHKGLWDSIWWASVTAMTVGYGDTYPVTAGGRVVAVALMHLVPLFVIPLFVARFLGKVVEDKNAFTHEEQQEVMAMLRNIDSNTTKPAETPRLLR